MPIPRISLYFIKHRNTLRWQPSSASSPLRQPAVAAHCTALKSATVLPSPARSCQVLPQPGGAELPSASGKAHSPHPGNGRRQRQIKGCTSNRIQQVRNTNPSAQDISTILNSSKAFTLELQTYCKHTANMASKQLLSLQTHHLQTPRTVLSWQCLKSPSIFISNPLVWVKLFFFFGSFCPRSEGACWFGVLTHALEGGSSHKISPSKFTWYLP